MRIGFVRRGYSPTGGAESYLGRLAGALAERGHECVLFGHPPWPRERLGAMKFVDVPGRSPRAFADALAAMHTRDGCEVLFSLERVWACDCFRAGDGVHRAWLERRARIEPPWRSFWRRWNPKHRQILRLEEALLGRGGAGTVIANSRMVQREMVAAYQTPPERIEVIYNGLPTAAFRAAAPEVRAQTRAALGLAERDYVVLFAGTGWERKGLRHLLAAIERLPAAQCPRLLVAGRGKVTPASSRVRFLGPVTDLAPYYAAADVFALPTLYDPFSNACLEAFAAGLPVITTDANGFSEILTSADDGTVIAADGDVPGALTVALTAWAEADRRLAGRERRLAKAAGYTIEANVEATMRTLTRMPRATASPGAS